MAQRLGTRTAKLRLLKPQLWQVLLLAIVCVAAGLRLWHLGTTPTPVHVDEASSGVAAWQLPSLILHLRIGRIAALAPVHATKGALVLEMVLLRIFGAGALQLRLASAFYGIAAVVGMFLLARALMDEGAGLIAAALMAVLHIPIAYARLGIPNTQAMFLLIMASWLLVEALKRDRWTWYAAAGVVGALGTYSYLGFRAFAVIAPAIILLQQVGDLIARRRAINWRRRALCLSVAAGAALVIAAPLGWKMLHGDEGGINETRRLSLISNMPQFERFYRTDDDVSIVWRQFRADWNYYSNGRDGSTHFRHEGQAVDVVTRVLFLAGMAVALLTIWRLSSQLALLLFWVPLSVASLVDSPPLGARMLLTFPGVVLLATIAIAGLAEASTWIVRRKAVAYAALALLLVVPAVYGPYIYFARYHHESDYFPWISPQSDVGEFARTFDGDVRTLDTLKRNLAPSETHLRFYNLGRGNIGAYHPGDAVPAGRTAFAVVADDADGLRLVEQSYPGGRVDELWGHLRADEKSATVVAKIYIVDVPEGASPPATPAPAATATPEPTATPQPTATRDIAGAGERDSERKTDLDKIATALRRYRGLHGAYPLAAAGQTLCAYPVDAGCSLKEILDPVPHDPLHSAAYWYQSDGASSFTLFARMELVPPPSACPTPLPEQLTLVDHLYCVSGSP